jgi:hypothetical protein
MGGEIRVRGGSANPAVHPDEGGTVSQVVKDALTLLHLYADDNGDTHFGTIDIALECRDFAPPAKPFNVSDVQPATQYVMISLPVGWVGEPHTSPKPQVLFCLTGSLKITCSTGEAAVIKAGMAFVMSDVSGKGHKSEVTSAEPVNGVIIQ